MFHVSKHLLGRGENFFLWELVGTNFLSYSNYNKCVQSISNSLAIFLCHLLEFANPKKQMRRRKTRYQEFCKSDFPFIKMWTQLSKVFSARGLGRFAGFLRAFRKSAATRIEEVQCQLLRLVAR